VNKTAASDSVFCTISKIRRKICKVYLTSCLFTYNLQFPAASAQANKTSYSLFNKLA